MDLLLHSHPSRFARRVLHPFVDPTRPVSPVLSACRTVPGRSALSPTQIPAFPEPVPTFEYLFSFQFLRGRYRRLPMKLTAIRARAMKRGGSRRTSFGEVANPFDSGLM